MSEESRLRGFAAAEKWWSDLDAPERKMAGAFLEAIKDKIGMGEDWDDYCRGQSDWLREREGEE